MADIANGGDGSTHKRLGRRSPLRIGLFHLVTTTMTPRNDRKFTTNAAATPARGYNEARERGTHCPGEIELDPVQRRCCRKIVFGNQFRQNCAPRGVSNASPAESANVNTSNSQGDMNPPMVKTTRSNATPIIHDSVNRTSLRRSTISPAEPAGRAAESTAGKRRFA